MRRRPFSPPNTGLFICHPPRQPSPPRPPAKPRPTPPPPVDNDVLLAVMEQGAAELRQLYIAARSEARKDAPTVTALIDTMLLNRENKARELYAKLKATREDRTLNTDTKTRMTEEVNVDLATLNRTTAADVRELAGKATAESQTRLAEGIRFTADELAEVPLVAQQFATRPKDALEQAHKALDAGAIRKARIHYRAAILLGLPASEGIGPAIIDTDPEMVAARSEVLTVERVVIGMQADIDRERAIYLMADGSAKASVMIGVKLTAKSLGLPPIAASGDKSFRTYIAALPPVDGRRAPDRDVRPVEPLPAVVPAV